MAEAHVVSALRAKYAELAGEIEACHKRLKELHAGLDHVAASLRLFDPNAVPERIQPKKIKRPDDWAERGEMVRLIINALRLANEPLDTKQVTLRVMQDRGFDTENPKFVKQMHARTRYTLRRLRDAERVDSDRGQGPWLTWWLVE